MLVITVQNPQQQSEHRFDDTEIVLGRFPNTAQAHVAIADAHVSRRQFVLRPASKIQISVDNIGRAKIYLADGQAIDTGEKRTVPLPVRLRVGKSDLHVAALVEDAPSDDDVFGSAAPDYQSIPAEGAAAPPELLSGLGETATAKRLTAWCETLLSVQRAAVGSLEFYDETARALVQLVDLDRGLVLLREQGAWRTIAGHAKDEHTGLQFSGAVLAQVLAEKKTLYGNPAQIASTASLVRVEAVVASPILDEAGAVVGALFGSRDLVGGGIRGELRPLDAQMVQILSGAVAAGHMRQRMQERLKANEQLAAVGQAIGYIIHDLRGPLGNARQLLEMLRNNSSETLSREEQFNYIEESVDVSLDLLNDSLEFCRGNVHVAPVRGLVGELLQKHLALLRMDLSAFSVELRIEIPPTLEATFDPARMARVLRNLAKNAGEAVAGRRGALVEIGAREVSGGVELWVADNGPGLPEQVRERLFQPFATQGKRGGTGFGLAIAKQLVEAHQGQIGVASNSHGTRFTISLPTGATAVLPSASSLANDATIVSNTRSGSLSLRGGRRLLLAEDGTVNQKLISGLLRNAGHEVIIAADGRAALEAWLQDEFDLVLMDLEMPVMSGLEAAAAMRSKENAGKRRTPIVALSAHETPEIREACRAAALDGYLEKPVRQESLLRLIEELCGLAATS